MKMDNDSTKKQLIKVKDPLSTPSTRSGFFWLFLIACANAAAFSGGLGGAFLNTWDDATYIVQNPLLQHLSPFAIPPLFTTYYFGNYAPLHLLSYMTDLMVWGMEPFGFHLSSLILHIINAMLLFALLVRSKLTPRASAVGALLFSVHPVQVETVVWISERKTILALFFMLLSLHAWIRWRRPPESGVIKSRFYWLALALFLMSLLSKSAAVIFPLILAGYWFSADRPVKPREFVLRLSPFFILSLLFSVIALISQSAEYAGGRLSEYQGNWFYTMPPVFAKYIGNVFWPQELLPVYSPGYRSVPDTAVIISIAILVLIFTTWVFAVKKERALLFWFTCIFAPMLPVSHIIPFSSLMNDHHLYIPMIGVAGIAAIAAERLAEKVAPPAGRTLLVIGTVLLLILVSLSIRQSAVWQNDTVLWRYVIDRSPQNPVLYWRLGEAQRFSGNLQGSIASYLRSLELKPGFPRAETGIAEALLETGQPQAAIPHALSLIRHSPRYHLGFTLLGEAYLKSGEHERAEAALSRALQLAPADRRSTAALRTLKTKDTPDVFPPAQK